MSEKTHFRKAFNSPYLSSADVVDPIVLTIKNVRLEKDRTKKTKEEFNTAHFTEKEIRKGEELKPMILNATNSKMLKEITGSPFIDDWNEIPVTVYVDGNVRFGKETVEGLRLKRGTFISADQCIEINDLIKVTEADLDRFLAYLGAYSVETIPSDKYRTAIAGLKAKVKK